MLLFLILALNKLFIDETIKIIKEYLKKLEFNNIVVQNKKIMFKEDFLIMRNVIKAIYRRQVKITLIHRFQFLEPISRFFHLQMNMLKFFLSAIWDKQENRIFFACFQRVLRQKILLRISKTFTYVTIFLYNCYGICDSVVYA